MQLFLKNQKRQSFHFIRKQAKISANRPTRSTFHFPIIPILSSSSSKSYWLVSSLILSSVLWTEENDQWVKPGIFWKYHAWDRLSSIDAKFMEVHYYLGPLKHLFPFGRKSGWSGSTVTSKPVLFLFSPSLCPPALNSVAQFIDLIFLEM